jgi:hypothetical protein
VRRTANVAAQYSSVNMQTEGFDASSLRTDRITLMVTTKLLDGHAPVLVEVLTGRRMELPIGWAYQSAGPDKACGASVAKDADNRLVVAIAGYHLNKQCCASHVIGAGENAGIEIHYKMIQLPSVKGLVAPAGKEIELDVARSIDGHRKSDLREAADVDGTDVFSAGRHLGKALIKHQFRSAADRRSQ